MHSHNKEPIAAQVEDAEDSKKIATRSPQLQPFSLNNCATLNDLA